MYSVTGPAKRKRALVETNSPRDNRMGLRRIARLGRLVGEPPQATPPQLSRAVPRCLENSGSDGPKHHLAGQADIFAEQLADIIAEQ
jgi:hypothetical protein